MRVRLHRHEQSGGPPAPASEDRLDPGGRLRKVHTVSELPGGRLPPLEQTDALPLPQVRLCRPGTRSNVRSQVSPSGVMTSAWRDEEGGFFAHPHLYLSSRFPPGFLPVSSRFPPGFLPVPSHSPQRHLQGPSIPVRLTVFIVIPTCLLVCH